MGERLIGKVAIVISEADMGHHGLGVAKPVQLLLSRSGVRKKRRC